MAIEPVAGLGFGVGLLAFGAAVHHVRSELATGTVPRNYGAGIRTRATMSSEAAWQAGHAAAGPALRLSYLTAYGTGALSLLISLALALLDAAHPVVLVVPGAGMAAALAFLVAATRKADKAARAVPDEGGAP
ncbi:SdpI family protein [Streptomyces albidoflavus]